MPKKYILTDSIHYKDEDGQFQSALRSDHPDGVDLSADEAKRLEDLGAVGSKDDAKKAATETPAGSPLEDGQAVVNEAQNEAVRKAEGNPSDKSDK